MLSRSFNRSSVVSGFSLTIDPIFSKLRSQAFAPVKPSIFASTLRLPEKPGRVLPSEVFMIHVIWRLNLVRDMF